MQRMNKSYILIGNNMRRLGVFIIFASLISTFAFGANLAARRDKRQKAGFEFRAAG